MIKIFDDFFIIETKNTSYVLRKTKEGYLEHLYYGSRIRIEEASDATILVRNLAIDPGNTIRYGKDNSSTLENKLLEVGTCGKGDLRDPFIKLTFPDGNRTSDFVFQSYSVINKPEYETLPTAYGNVNKNTLKIVLKEKSEDVLLELYYTAFCDTDVITRQNVLLNKSDKNIRIDRILSAQLDLEGNDYILSTFNGAWAREMNRNDIQVCAGMHINSSVTGTSSNRSNPFIMLSKNDTNEDRGICYGINLIYSGNHYESVCVNSSNDTRVLTGINPETFEWILEPEGRFEAPEAVITFSGDGFNGMSQNMHEFVRNNIIRGEWKHKDRPVLLNSWEASYFKINEHKLLNLARKSKEVGIELFVMDDGWFGKRDDDTKSLGDWYVNTKKLPGGLSGLAKKINALGLMFGIWVEPEMVNEDSDLYRNHPEWALKHPEREHSTGRNQMLLDLGNESVQEYIIAEMSRVFSSANISYVKWDMNRIFSDYYSSSLNIERMGEVSHRYVCGLYRVMKVLTEKFPKILFEGCASGGNRFDLGILCYFPQIWASDNTDAISRATIQTGYSYGYPMSTVASHVSGTPNHQTLRVTPMETRFNVASFGILGYECNLCDLKKDELEEIKEDIEFYKSVRNTMQWGHFYRGRCFNSSHAVVSSLDSNASLCNKLEWSVVSDDKEEALALTLQKNVIPNAPIRKLKIKGLDKNRKYTLSNREKKKSIKEYGDLVNTVSPVHIKQGSMVMNLVDKVYKLNSEKELVTAYGDAFMENGANLKMGFIGTGLNDEVATFQDYASRLYHLKIHEKCGPHN